MYCSVCAKYACASGKEGMGGVASLRLLFSAAQAPVLNWRISSSSGCFRRAGVNAIISIASIAYMTEEGIEKA